MSDISLEIKKQIQESRKNLLDMGMRNNLLNFRELKRNIPIIDENPAELCQILVFEEKFMEFIPNPEKEKDEKNINSEILDESEDIIERKKNLWTIPLQDEDIPDKHKDIYLQTDLSEKELQKRLFTLNQDYKTSLEEQGYNNLYLALGFLEWKEFDYNDLIRKSPLILIPVKLYRESIGKPFTIEWDHEDIQYNLSLQYKLREQGVDLPSFEDFESKEDIYSYFNEVNSSILNKEGWKINNSIFLSKFNFRKFVMYKDLDLDEWLGDVKDNPIKELFYPNDDEIWDDFDENQIDKLIPPADVFHVVDADSSQITVIEEVKKGKNLVVEGPPGTGKSQTIVNIIAELMANKKTVLFVSEKMAALNVVKDRLDAIGLGNGCLEIHSNKSNKKDVLRSIEKALSSNIYAVKDDIDFHNLESLREKLNLYMDTIHKKYKNTDLSIYQLIGVSDFNRQLIENLDQDLYRFEMGNLGNLDSQKRGEMINNLEIIEDSYNAIKPVESNPWRYTSPEKLFPEDIETIEYNLISLINEINNILSNINNLFNITGAKDLKNLDEIEVYTENCKILKSDPKLLNGNDLNKLINSIENYQEKTKNIDKKIFSEDLENIKKKVKNINNNINSLNLDQNILKNENLDEIIFEIKKYDNKIKTSEIKNILRDDDLNKKLNLFKSKKNSFFKIFNAEFKSIRDEFRGYYSNEKVSEDKIVSDFDNIIKWNDSLNDLRERILDYCENETTDGKILIESEKLLSWANQLENINNELSNFTFNSEKSNLENLENDLNNFIEIKNQLEYIKSMENMGNHFFKDIWKGSETDVTELKEKYDIIIIFNKLYSSGFFSQKTVENLNDNLNINELDDYLNLIKNNKLKVLENYNIINNLLNFKNEELEIGQIQNTNLVILKKEFSLLLDNMGLLHEWKIYKSNCEEYQNDYNKELISLLNNDKLIKESIIPTFNYNFGNNAMKDILGENKTLNNFSSSMHEKNIEKFKELDKKIINLNRYRVQEVLWKNLPNISSVVNPLSELGVLLKEMNKKRRIKPIRKILSECSKVIRDIKPCFMMSPLSIAQFLDPKHYESHFDFVIFDEASQIKSEDALGAMLRGKNYIIMGDTKQLPPTIFFDGGSIDDENENMDDIFINDVESILHFCSSVFPNKMLKWHYRSKHESLIAVSNEEFYNNDLFIYPSPIRQSEELGLKLNYSPDTIYYRGNSSNNPKEAVNVIDYAIEHFKKHGINKSLGIGTFSMSQKQAILEELELKLKENPELQQYFNETGKEGFFVKNLENIQGDERDVILISIGYGFDSDKKLLYNFGPLNRDGGERRLNVLITRAREKCVVFSNFKSKDLNLERSYSKGIRALKNFLFYAETGKFPSNYKTGHDFDSDFEKSVYNFLDNEGFIVEKQIGCAGFRIDLAIVDKENNDNYIIGIECDGAPYHSSSVARDRDRLRQEILEGLGWTFHRIWSTEWYHNRKNAREKLLNAIELANKHKNDIKKDIENISTEIVVEKFGKILEKKETKQNFEIKKNNAYVYYKQNEKLYNFYDKPNYQHFDLIGKIMELEAPIHKNEIYDRIKRVYGVKSTEKFKNHINLLLKDMRNNRMIFIKNDFCYNSETGEIIIRERKKPNIDLICDEEIKKTILHVLKEQYSLDADSLSKSSSKLLGFGVFREKIKNRYSNIIKKMVSEKEIKYVESSERLELM